MATIIPRGKSYSIVYRFEGEQYWETAKSLEAANSRRDDIEYEIKKGTFIPPPPKKRKTANLDVDDYPVSNYQDAIPTLHTVNDLVDVYVERIAAKRWGPKTYPMKMSYIKNYIRPYIGQTSLHEANAMTVDMYYDSLSKMSRVSNRHNPNKNGDLVSAKTIEEVHKILNPAFKLAVRWELLTKCPTADANRPEHIPEDRPSWSMQELKTAFALVADEGDELLEYAMHVAFVASGRAGEIAGITWDVVDISDESIASNNASIFINKQLQRVERSMITEMKADPKKRKTILYEFPGVISGASSALILRMPKTLRSIRKVWIPPTFARMLQRLKEAQNQRKAILSNEYNDYNLVICQANGRPVEAKYLLKRLQAFIKRHGLPEVVFHSLRSTSAGTKLKLNHGDVKAVQGDTGHSQAKMILDVYAKIQDEDRRDTAMKIEREIYAPQTAGALPNDAAAIIEMLQKQPELAATLAQALTVLAGGNALANAQQKPTC